MRILFVHNRYQQTGGEDSVVQAESRLLLRMGHEVEVWEENNDSIVSRMDALVTGFQSVYSFEHARKMGERIRCFRPDLVHMHNFFPRLSPSIHRACFRAGVPVVQTLHNFRLLCPAATFSGREKVCEECLGKSIPWPSILHGCYRKSRAASAAVATMLSIHRALGTWRHSVSHFIALSEFARDRFIAGGLPSSQISSTPIAALARAGETSRSSLADWLRRRESALCLRLGVGFPSNRSSRLLATVLMLLPWPMRRQRSERLNGLACAAKKKSRVRWQKPAF